MPMLGLAQTDRIARLSSAQCDCLRLVAEHRSSKEIARLLLISPHTVDQRLKRAASILAVSSRFEAARLFANHERRSETAPSVYGGLIYQSPELYPGGANDEMEPSPDELNPLGGGTANSTLHEAQASYFTHFPQAAPPSLSSVLSGARYENDLPVLWRLIIILGIMLGGIFGFAVLVNIAEGLSRIY